MMMDLAREQARTPERSNAARTNSSERNDAATVPLTRGGKSSGKRPHSKDAPRQVQGRQARQCTICGSVAHHENYCPVQHPRRDRQCSVCGSVEHNEHYCDHPDAQILMEHQREEYQYWRESEGWWQPTTPYCAHCGKYGHKYKECINASPAGQHDGRYPQGQSSSSWQESRRDRRR